MKKLLLTALLTTLFSGNLWAQVSDWRLTNEGVEIEVLEKTVKIKIMAQSHSAKLGDRRFDTVHLPGTFGKKSNIIELNLDKSKCYIPTNPDLINCRDSEANITVINGDGKVDVSDLLLLQQTLVGQITLSPLQSVRADLHPAAGDGLIDLSDLLGLESILSPPP